MCGFWLQYLHIHTHTHTHTPHTLVLSIQLQYNLFVARIKICTSFCYNLFLLSKKNKPNGDGIRIGSRRNRCLKTRTDLILAKNKTYCHFVNNTSVYVCVCVHIYIHTYIHTYIYAYILTFYIKPCTTGIAKNVCLL